MGAFTGAYHHRQAFWHISRSFRMQKLQLDVGMTVNVPDGHIRGSGYGSIDAMLDAVAEVGPGDPSKFKSWNQLDDSLSILNMKRVVYAPVKRTLEGASGNIL